VPIPAKDPAPGLLRRCALGLWFGGIAALGGIEFHRAACGNDGFAPTAVAWLWLAGSVACALVAIALLLRELRRAR